MSNIPIDTVAVGKRIAKLRADRGLSQTTLGENISVARQTVSKWERGLINLTLDDAVKLCNCLDCDIGYLMGEYETFHHMNASIQEVTGLSEIAIDTLSSNKMYSCRTLTPPSDSQIKYKIISPLDVKAGLEVDVPPVIQLHDPEEYLASLSDDERQYVKEHCAYVYDAPNEVYPFLSALLESPVLYQNVLPYLQRLVNFRTEPNRKLVFSDSPSIFTRKEYLLHQKRCFLIEVEKLLDEVFPYNFEKEDTVAEQKELEPIL